VVEKDDQPSDSDLDAAVNRGDWSAFDALYHRHKEWVYRVAWRFTADENEALDVVQDVFVYLAGKFRTGPFDLRVRLTTFLYPAIKHTAVTLKQKRRRMNASSGAADADIPAPPAASRALADLAAVLSRLSDAHREVIVMRFVDDLTLEEIAAALAIPLGTAKSRLHHALADLRADPAARRWFEA
jgi:RNA polymerase sigma-70 factor (ECF subfamily)